MYFSERCCALHITTVCVTPYTLVHGGTCITITSPVIIVHLISLLFVVNKLRCTTPERKGALTYGVVTYVYSRGIHQGTHHISVALSYTCTSVNTNP